MAAGRIVPVFVDDVGAGDRDPLRAFDSARAS